MQTIPQKAVPKLLDFGDDLFSILSLFKFLEK